MKPILLGAASSVVLALVGIRIDNWRWWVLIAWILIHTMTWKYLDEREVQARARREWSASKQGTTYHPEMRG